MENSICIYVFKNNMNCSVTFFSYISFYIVSKGGLEACIKKECCVVWRLFQFWRVNWGVENCCGIWCGVGLHGGMW